MPELYIITGSNGAGKSSIGSIYLPESIRKNCDVFDGDRLYMQQQRVLWAQGIRAHKEAKKMALSYVEETFDQLVSQALKNHDDFVYEGHFTNDATWSVPTRFKENGYTANMIFLGLNSPDLSELRVIDRSKQGGHYVPRLTIEDNFYGNLEKLNLHYTILDSLKIMDTSEATHRLLAHFIGMEVRYMVPLDQLPEWFTKNLTNLIKDV